jgi:hypothetical protein
MLCDFLRSSSLGDLWYDSTGLGQAKADKIQKGVFSSFYVRLAQHTFSRNNRAAQFIGLREFCVHRPMLFRSRTSDAAPNSMRSKDRKADRARVRELMDQRFKGPFPLITSRYHKLWHYRQLVES